MRLTVAAVVCVCVAAKRAQTREPRASRLPASHRPARVGHRRGGCRVLSPVSRGTKPGTSRRLRSFGGRVPDSAEARFGRASECSPITRPQRPPFRPFPSSPTPDLTPALLGLTRVRGLLTKPLLQRAPSLDVSEISPVRSHPPSSCATCSVGRLNIAAPQTCRAECFGTPLSTEMEARGSFGPGTVAVWLLRPLLPDRSPPVEARFLSPPLPVLSLSLLFFVLFTFSALSCLALHLQE